MKRKKLSTLAGSLALLLVLAGPAPQPSMGGETEPDKDFSTLTSAKDQEKAYEYQTFFLPAPDGPFQAYVGDTMPYYEDGTWYIYYLKEGGDSWHHSIYLAETQDFVSYRETDEPILEAAEDGQDEWIGTGSVCKAGDSYYLFYTGHTSSDSLEYKEKILAAKGEDLHSFEKITDWDITPPEEIHQKTDFRDPQAYYDPETGLIRMTVTASCDGIARILQYTLNKELTEAVYDGIIFTNQDGDFWNLECSDTFCIGDTWYLTYSAQDDTLWYACAETPEGPYSDPRRLEGKLFYAAKHVENEDGTYMTGWARRSESPSSMHSVNAWGGNLLTQKLVRKDNGDLALLPVDAVVDQYKTGRELLLDGGGAELDGSAGYVCTDAFTCYESYMVKGSFVYEGEGSFGLCFDYNGEPERDKLISVDPSDNEVRLAFNNGETEIAEQAFLSEPGTEYHFTYIQEGSVGTFYIDDLAALTVRIYGASGKPVRLYAEDASVCFSDLEQYTR